MAEAEDKLRFLHVLLPRTAYARLLQEEHGTASQTSQGTDTESNNSTPDASGGVRRYVVRNGAAVEVNDDGDSSGAGGTEKAKYSNWREGNVDPDALARHHASIRRFNFLDRGTPPPRGPVW